MLNGSGLAGGCVASQSYARFENLIYIWILTCKFLSNLGRVFLIHLPLDKMAAVLTNLFNCIFLNENDTIPIQISLKPVPKSPIGIKPALVLVMA